MAQFSMDHFISFASVVPSVTPRVASAIVSGRRKGETEFVSRTTIRRKTTQMTGKLTNRSPNSGIEHDEQGDNRLSEQLHGPRHMCGADQLFLGQGMSDRISDYNGTTTTIGNE